VDGLPEEPMGPRSVKPKGNNKALLMISKFTKFIGPGFMVAVAYIDPGNYSTDVAAGANTGFKLLFIVLMSNLFAAVLQSLAVRLGTVTGMNLAEHCRANLPRWLNYVLYFLAEAAIIATDIAEVIGSAIAFNLLLKIPLVAGCALTLVDVLIILVLYQPDGSMRGVRIFEYVVAAMVVIVVICFCIQLSYIKDTSVGEVFLGYVPSSTVVAGSNIYLSCGILGATVMPHSLYLGSGLCQPRLKEYDDAHPENHSATQESDRDSMELDNTKPMYRPSLDAIKYCLKSSTIELVISLSIFALFVNSAILIVAGASLYGNDEAKEADLFSIHDLLARTIAPAAGTLFAVALLFSGTSAGIVCTIAGQMVSEGQINWKLKPWLRRLLTRSLSITPSIIIAGAIGRNGLSAALNASQVALSVILPFVSAPLIYFTCKSSIMRVGGPADSVGVLVQGAGQTMRNHMLVCILSVMIWIVIAVMNVALIVFAAMGKT
jgi:metal iron transporter